jgi:hypothetical protein
MRNINIFLFLVLFSSCSTLKIDVIQVGPVFPSHNRDIKLYTDKNQVEKPFGGLAILHSDRFDCSVNLQRKIIDKAKKEAQKLGADGIVYYFDFGERNQDLAYDERCFFSGLAIKFVDVDVLK